MEIRTNNDKIKALKKAKIGIDKEKANIKEELKKLAEKRKSEKPPEAYIKGKYKALTIQYAIAATEAAAVDLAKNQLEIEEAEKHLKQLNKARKGIKAAVTADEIAGIGLLNLFDELDNQKKSYTEDLKKFAETLIK